MTGLKAVETIKKLEAKKRKEFRLSLEYGLMGDSDAVSLFLARLEKNEKLQKACRAVKKEGVDIWLREEFGVSTLGAKIDVRSTDDKIIEFLTEN